MEKEPSYTAWLFLHYNYCGWGAPTGQTFAQEPQSMHALSSMMYLVSPAEMQLTGHSGSQAPQLMQSSLITYAITNTSIFHLSLFHQLSYAI